MKMLFVYSVEDADSSGRPVITIQSIQSGISIISALVKKYGHETRLVTLASSRGKSSVGIMQETLSEYKPDMVLFTSVATQFAFIEQIAGITALQWPKIFLIAGGPHVSLNPEKAILGPFHALCIGEGELPVLELVQAITEKRPYSGIANLWIKNQDGTISRNVPRPFEQDLDAFPFPDLAMWENWLVPSTSVSIPVLLGRGCPFGCTYCSNHALHTLATGRYVRFRSPKNIIAEITCRLDQFPGRTNYYLEVEAIGINKQWTLSLCKELEGLNASLPVPLEFAANFRVTPATNDSELFDALAKANIRSLNIGLEAGSERVRRDILNRKYSNAQFLAAIKLARDRAISVVLYNMIGLPTETPKEHAETVALNRMVQPDRHYTSIFFPYPGTDLHDLSIKKGYLKKAPKTSGERRHAVLDMPQFRPRSVQSAFFWFDYCVYRGHRPLFMLLKRMIFLRISSSENLLGFARFLKKCVGIIFVPSRP